MSVQVAFVPQETETTLINQQPIYQTKVDPNNVEKMKTGAQRSSNTGRGRYDLIPGEAKRRVAIKYEQGAQEPPDGYGPRNWEKGMPFSRLINSAMRHIDQYNEGDRSEDHLAAAVWNLNAVMHFEKYRPDLNDLPKYNTIIPQNIN